MPWQCLSFSLIPIFWLEEADLVQIWSLDLITGKKKKHEISTTSPFNPDVFYPQIEISRENNEVSFGLTLCNEISEDELGKTIVIETVVIDSPAYSVGVMAKDVLVAIDGKKIESLKQAAKLIKSKSRYLVPLISSFELHITSGVFLANLNFRNFMKIFWRLGTFQLSLKPFLKFTSDHLPFNHSGIITVTDSTCNSKPDCRCLSYKLWLNVNPELSVSVHQTGDIRLTMDSSKICRLLPLKTFVAERISGLAQEPQPRLLYCLTRLLKLSHPHGCCSYFIINFFYFSFCVLDSLLRFKDHLQEFRNESIAKSQRTNKMRKLSWTLRMSHFTMTATPRMILSTSWCHCLKLKTTKWRKCCHEAIGRERRKRWKEGKNELFLSIPLLGLCRWIVIAICRTKIF